MSDSLSKVLESRMSKKNLSSKNFQNNGDYDILKILNNLSIYKKEYNDVIIFIKEKSIDDFTFSQEKFSDNNIVYQVVILNYAVKYLNSIFVHWYLQCSENIELFNQRASSLILALINLDFDADIHIFMKPFESFITTLVAFHTSYAEIVVCTLLKKISNTLIEYYVELIVKVLKTVPLIKNFFSSILARTVPFIDVETQIQYGYYYSLLILSSFLPDLRHDILELIIYRIVCLDTMVSREEMTELKIDLENINENSLASNHEFIKNLSYVNTLDVLLNMIFEFIIGICFDNTSLESNWVFEEILQIFIDIVLTTCSISHSQFIIFYITSVNPIYCQKFLTMLFKKIKDPNTSSFIREIAACYIGSFVARANFVSLSMAKSILKTLSDWIHMYINSQCSSFRFSTNLSYHGPFYALCQAVFYIIIFRHKEFMNNLKANVAFLRSLNLEHIITCKLNPLKFCNPFIVQNFANITRHLQLAYCYTIMENNSRSSVPQIFIQADGTVKHSVDKMLNDINSFYPFDPCLLKRIDKYVKPIYREYEGHLEILQEIQEPMIEIEAWYQDNTGNSFHDMNKNNSVSNSIYAKLMRELKF